MEVRDIAYLIMLLIVASKWLYDWLVISAKHEARFKDLEANLAMLLAERQEYKQFITALHEQMPKIDLFWDFIRHNMPKMILHPDDAIRDMLLLKLSSNTLKHAEGIDLKALLENEYEHMPNKCTPEALINRFALIALEQLLKEPGRE